MNLKRTDIARRLGGEAKLRALLTSLRAQRLSYSRITQELFRRTGLFVDPRTVGRWCKEGVISE